MGAHKLLPITGASKTLLIIAITIATLAGCQSTKPLYHYGSYQDNVYEHFKNEDAAVTEQIEALEKTIRDSNRNKLQVGPGIYAHLGYLYLQSGQRGNSARQLIERIPVQMGTGTAGGTPHAGRLQLIDNQVDAKSGTVRVRAVFDNEDGSLIPGQFARIRMGQARNTQALLINERAVGTDQNKKFVMVVGEGNKAEYREVTLGAPIDGLRVVTSGLKAGENIVVNGLQRVRPGAVVAPQPVPMTAKAEIAGDRKEAKNAAKSPAA